MVILGIHDGYNCSAALVRDGKLVSAVQQERLSRRKNAIGFPNLAIEEVLRIAKLSIGDVDTFVYAGQTCTNWQRDNDFGKLLFEATNCKSVSSKHRIEHLVEQGVEKDKIKFFDHHLCHSATAYYGKSWGDDPVLTMTCDGGGDGVCATVNVCQKGGIENIAEISGDNSAAVVYSMITMLMGFRPFEEEFKIMGLAPYGSGSESCLNICGKIYDLFKFDCDNGLLWKREDIDLKNYLTEVIRCRRFDDIAAGVQLFVEKFFVQWIKNCISATGIGRIALAGGLFMNVKLNKAIMEIPEIEDLFVFPSCSDESLSIGAAWLSCSDEISPLGAFYTGGDFDNKSEQAVQSFNFSQKVKTEYFDDIEFEIARLLADGNVVARCRGASEFGARALGNRSILADASDVNLVRNINKMIKMRDFWMPFAPSFLEKEAENVIKNPKNVKADYMILAFDVDSKRAENMMAALHPADLTARPQIVRKEYNPYYYNLLQHYKEMAGKGFLLNTSLNLHGSPMVYRPEDALDVFDKSGLQYLALGNYLISKV